MNNELGVLVAVLVVAVVICTLIIAQVKRDLREHMNAFCKVYQKKVDTQTRVIRAVTELEQLEAAVSTYGSLVSKTDADDLWASLTKMRLLGQGLILYQRLIADLQAIEGVRLTPDLNRDSLARYETVYDELNDNCRSIEDTIENVQGVLTKLKSIGTKTPA